MTSYKSEGLQLLYLLLGAIYEKTLKSWSISLSSVKQLHSFGGNGFQELGIVGVLAKKAADMIVWACIWSIMLERNTGIE